MKPITIIVLVGLLVVCLVVALIVTDVFEPPKPEKQAKKEQPKLFKAEPGKPRSLTVQRKAEKIVFEKAGEDWRITEPIKAKARNWRVDGIADALKDLRGELVIDVGARKAGLDEPEATVSLVSAVKDEKDPKKHKEVTHTLLIGGDRPMHKGQTYVRPAGSKKVFAVKIDFADKLDKPLGEFRDDTVLDLKKEKIARVQVSGRENYELVKRKDQWGIVKPISAPADKEKVKDLLDDISRVTASEFVTDAPGSLADYGLDKPRLTVRVEMEPNEPATKPTASAPAPKPGEKYGLAIGREAFGKKVGDKLYAKLLDAPTVFKVNASLLKDLSVPLNDLRDKRVLRVEADEVTAADLELPAGKASLVKADGTWRMTAPRTGKANASAVKKLLDDLADLKAESFRDDVPTLSAYGLDKPAARITLRLAGKGETAGLLIGTKSPSGEMTFVKSAAGIAVAVVRTADVARLLAEAVSYWDATILKLPARTKVTRLQLRRTDETFTLQRDANDNWSLTTPLACAADTDQVNKVIDHVEDLTAEKIVALGPGVPDRYAKAKDIMQVAVRTILEPETQPASAPATKPAATKPAATKPAATKPTAATKPAATKPAATKPAVATRPAPKPKPRDYTLTVVKLGLHSYAWRAGEKTTAVGQFAPGLYDDLAGGLRSKEAWKIVPDDVRGLKIVAGKDSVELRKQKDAWQYVADPFVKIDAEKVSSYLKDIKEISAKKFVTHKAGDGAKFGLDKPWLRLELTDEAGKKRTLAISHEGATKTKDRYASASTVQGVFILSADMLDKVGKKLKDFRK